MSDEPTAAFFDLSSLGSLRRSSRSAETDHFQVYSQVRALLDQLRAEDIRLGVIGGPGHRTERGLVQLIRQSDLWSLLTSELIFVEGKEDAAQFTRAIEAAGHSDDPSQCVFVGDDRNGRNGALAAGLRVAPHPRLAIAVLGGARLRYVRVTVPDEHAGQDWRPVVADLDVVPLRIAGARAATFYAIATSPAAAQLDDLGFQVDRLGLEDQPLRTDVYLLRDDRQTKTGFLVPEGASSARFSSEEEAGSVLASTREGFYVAIGAGRSVESYHFEDARHGHTEKLVPAQSLLQPLGEGLGLVTPLTPLAKEPVLGDDERRAFAEVTPALIASELARYTGAEPVDTSGTRIRSRHILHPDNAVAVEALVSDLEAVGDGQLDVKLHQFTHEGRSLDNVEAELRGAELDELVLVTAHLDSTAQSTQGYDPAQDDAPGADDDASGSVGVLALARALAGLRLVKPPKRTIRFVLFNAEEHGLVGSRAYAHDQSALAAPIVAVFQMDMMGYNREPPATFEVHAGFAFSPKIEERSKVLAERIAKAVDEVSPNLPAPQIYLTKPQEPDPADGRSDHTSFQQVGYAACATTEDFFASPGPDSQSEPNPNYHTVFDTFVDVDYAADITRAIGAAVWLTANL